jgi:hypothetical protein
VSIEFSPEVSGAPMAGGAGSAAWGGLLTLATSVGGLKGFRTRADFSDVRCALLFAFGPGGKAWGGWAGGGLLNGDDFGSAIEESACPGAVGILLAAPLSRGELKA